MEGRPLQRCALKSRGLKFPPQSPQCVSKVKRRLVGTANEISFVESENPPSVCRNHQNSCYFRDIQWCAFRTVSIIFIQVDIGLHNP